MENKYYFHNGKEKIGPFDIDEIIQVKDKISDLENEGKVYVWCKGMKQWTEIGLINELKEMFLNELEESEEPPEFKIGKNENIEITSDDTEPPVFNIVNGSSDVNSGNISKEAKADKEKIISLRDAKRLDLEWSYKKNKWIDFIDKTTGLVLILIVIGLIYAIFNKVIAILTEGDRDLGSWKELFYLIVSIPIVFWISKRLKFWIDISKDDIEIEE